MIAGEGATNIAGLMRFIMECGVRIDPTRTDAMADLSLDIADFLSERAENFKTKEVVIAIYGLLKVIQDGASGVR